MEEPDPPIVEYAKIIAKYSSRTTFNIGVFGGMGLGKSSFINTVLCLFGKHNPKAPVSHETTSVTTVVKKYQAFQDKEITINLVDAWGIQQEKWNEKYFEEYLDGILDGVDKDRIEIRRANTKNPICSLDLVLFFFTKFHL